MSIILKNKPLVEAIFEFKWQIPQDSRGLFVDPNYKFLIGLFYQSIKERFPVNFSLPNAEIPSEFSAYNVQYQFKKKLDSWPVIQLGPGMITVNETINYKWENYFDELCTYAFNKLQDVYPIKENLIPNEISLRFINAINIDFKKINLFEYLKNKLKLKIELPTGLFENQKIVDNPYTVDLSFVLPLVDPIGAIIYKFNKAQINGNEVLLFELTVTSKGEHIKLLTNNFKQWLDSAHKRAEESFLTFIDGDLLREYTNA